MARIDSFSCVRRSPLFGEYSRFRLDILKNRAGKVRFQVYDAGVCSSDGLAVMVSQSHRADLALRKVQGIDPADEYRVAHWGAKVAAGERPVCDGLSAAWGRGVAR